MKNNTKNILFITDIHVQMINKFNEMFFQENIEKFFSRLDFGLDIQDKTDENINIYFGGDIFNIFTYSKLNNIIFSYFGHLFLIKKYLEIKNLKLNNVYYVLGNHEIYVDIKNLYHSNNNFSNYFFIYGKQNYEKEYNYEYEKEFVKILRKQKFQEKEILTFGEKTGTVGFHINKYLYEKFINFNFFSSFQLSDKNNIINSIIEDVLKFVFEKENFVFNLDFEKVQYDEENKRCVIGSILFAPYLGEFNNNLDDIRYSGLLNVNDVYFLRNLITSKNVNNELQYGCFENINSDENSKHIFETYLEILDLLEPILNQYDLNGKKTSGKLFEKVSYLKTQGLFHYYYLQLLDTIIGLKGKDIQELNIITHFPFDVFGETLNSLGIQHTIDKQTLETIKNYQKGDTNTYFNVHEKYLFFLLEYIKKYIGSIKKINFFSGHTHLPHKSILEDGNIKITFNNSSFEYFTF